MFSFYMTLLLCVIYPLMPDDIVFLGSVLLCYTVDIPYTIELFSDKEQH